MKDLNLCIHDPVLSVLDVAGYFGQITTLEEKIGVR